MRAISVVILLLIVLFLPWFPRVKGSGCSIRFTGSSPSRMPQATNPGDLIVKFWFDLTTDDPSNTNLGVNVEGNNIEPISESISKSSKSGSVYVRVRESPGEYADLSITITCQVNGYSDSDTMNLGRSYIVAIPRSWSASISPSIISKRDRIALEVSGLGSIDDGIGSLTVSAKLGSHTYSLDRTSRGSFRKYVSVNFIDQPAGSKSVTFTVYKYYSGVSAEDSKTRSFTVRGSPPKISANVPSQVHRSDSIDFTVSESDGDSVSGSLLAFGKKYSLVKGDNIIKVPIDVAAGHYTLNAVVKDVDGSNNGSWDTEIVNVPPEVTLSLDKEKVASGQSVKISVSAQDDSAGLKVSLSVSGGGIHREWNLSESGGTISYRTPDGFEGNLSVKAEAIDIDGATAYSSAQIEVGSPPTIEGDIPSTVHRGDKYTIKIEGKGVSGSISYMDKEIDVRGEGSYTIEIPSYVKAGKYEVKVVAKNDFGGISRIWNIFLENNPPKVDISLDRGEVKPGDDISVHVRASDDSPGVEITLSINNSVYHFKDEGTAQYSVPLDASRLEIVADAVDIDGAKASTSRTVIVHRKTSTTTTTTSTTSTTTYTTNNPTQTSTSTGKAEIGGTVSEQLQKTEDLSNLTSTSTKEQFTPYKNTTSSKTRSKLPTRTEGGLSVRVIPSNPLVGQNVTVIAVPSGGVKGRLWILNPLREIVKDIPIISRKVILLLVDAAGKWSVRWAYRSDGNVKFGQLDFEALGVKPENETYMHHFQRMEEGEYSTSTISNSQKTIVGEIKRFSARCMVYTQNRKEKGNITPDAAMMLIAITLLAYLIIRRRLS